MCTFAGAASRSGANDAARRRTGRIRNSYSAVRCAVTNSVDTLYRVTHDECMTRLLTITIATISIVGLSACDRLTPAGPAAVIPASDGEANITATVNTPATGCEAGVTLEAGSPVPCDTPASSVTPTTCVGQTVEAGVTSDC
jgi:hypothetical protein